jgi:putative cardiolipin synthase
MHNKVMIADGRVAIVGGRNIGDAYFGLSEHSNFHDLDVLAVGPIVGDVANAFDGYWNSELVLGAQRAPNEEDRSRLLEGRARIEETLASDPRLEDLPRGQADWSERIAALPGRLTPGVGRVVVDEAEPQEGEAGQSYRGLAALFQKVKRDVLVENAYWIPSDRIGGTLEEFERRQVRIRVVTNSLSSHDVPAVNGAFKKRRVQLLEGGVELYELRADAAVKALQDTSPVDSEFLGLHTKAFVLDGEVVYVGSHNLDPRSHVINTEMGLVIESPALGAELTELIERDMLPENSWHVVLGENGRPLWVAGEERHTRQPSRGFGQRIADWFFGLLPIEDQL